MALAQVLQRLDEEEWKDTPAGLTLGNEEGGHSFNSTPFHINTAHPSSPPSSARRWGGEEVGVEGVSSARARRPVACHKLTNIDTCNSFWCLERVWSEIRELQGVIDAVSRSSSSCSSNDVTADVSAHSFHPSTLSKDETPRRGAGGGACSCGGKVANEWLVEMLRCKVLHAVKNVVEAVREQEVSSCTCMCKR